MKKLLLLFVTVLVPSLFIAGCGDDLTTRTENVDVTLDSFQLTYTPPAGASELAGAAVAASTSGGNPSCGTVNLNGLLADNPDWQDIADRIKEVSISETRYRIISNSTPFTVTGRLQLTNNNTGLLTVVGEKEIAPLETINDWTELPFVNNGQNIVNHYLSHRDESFQYCVESTPNNENLNMTIEIQLGLKAKVKIL
ncbi:MAG: hypothetical protein IT392_04505 [Nitrospirae bacterium]|nr:hypothetical protein [Nitrospirota bacterium]